MKALILCAGEGTRFRPYTFSYPKPRIPFMNIPMAFYGLEWLQETAVSELIVNTYHLSDQIHALFKKQKHLQQPIVFSDEAPLLRNSGGALDYAKQFLTSEHFVVTNGDEVFLPHREGQLKAAFQYHLEQKALATLVVMNHKDVGTKFGGVWVDEEKNVLGFGLKKTTGATFGYHYIGFLFCRQDIFKYIAPRQPLNILHDVLALAIEKKQKICCYQVSGWWHETGNPADYISATKQVLDLLKSHKDSYEVKFFNQLNARLHQSYQLSEQQNLFVTKEGLKSPYDQTLVLADDHIITSQHLHLNLE